MMRLLAICQRLRKSPFDYAFQKISFQKNLKHFHCMDSFKQKAVITASPILPRNRGLIPLLNANDDIEKNYASHHQVTMLSRIVTQKERKIKKIR